MATKFTDEQFLELNKIKWDGWAECDTLDQKKVRMMPGFNVKYDFHKYQETVVDVIDFANVKTFLDIGCGTGWAVRFAFQKARGEGEFYGLDLSEKMIAKARSSEPPNNCVHFDQGDTSVLPYVDNYFDAVICTNAFHHFPHPGNVLAEVYRVLKKKGAVYILDPTTDMLLVKLANVLHIIFEKEHVSMYSTQEYKRMFATVNLVYKSGPSMQGPGAGKIHIGRKI